MKDLLLFNNICFRMVIMNAIFVPLQNQLIYPVLNIAYSAPFQKSALLSPLFCPTSTEFHVSCFLTGTSQHSSVVSSGSAAGSGTGGGSSAGGYCLPLSATLSSPILRAGLTNPQQKQLLHTIPHTPSNSTHTHISAHAIQQVGQRPPGKIS